MAAMREQMLKNKLYKGVLWLIMLSMAGGTLLYSPAIFRLGSATKPIVMSINNQEISYKDLEQKINQEIDRIAMLRQQYGEYADSLLAMLGLDNPQQVALQSLVQEALINQVADDLSIRISQDFVMQKLQDPMFVVQELRDVVPVQVLDQQGRINMHAFRYYLSRSRISEADFEQALENVLRRKTVNDLMKSGIYI